jgi:hypothetical protein
MAESKKIKFWCGNPKCSKQLERPEDWFDGWKIYTCPFCHHEVHMNCDAKEIREALNLPPKPQLDVN